MNEPLPPTTSTEQLATLISAKLKILDQVLELTRMQPAIIEGGDMSRLLQVLAAKERLLNDLKSLEGRLTPFRNQNPDARIWRSQEKRLSCRAEAERCEAVLKDIVTMETKCEGELVQRRDLTAARIHAANDASRARTAYVNDSGVQRSLDLTSE